MLDDLDELRTFARILARGSLSAAARDLNVGLAVVSKRLASLERRAGHRLIQRTTRRLSPTDEGIALLAHVERLLEELAGAEDGLARGRAAPQGLLRVSAPITFGRIHLLPLAAEMAAAYPALSVEVRLEDRLVDLVEERIDVAVRIGQPRDSSAILHRLADNHRILVAAPGYLNRRGHPAVLADLARHDCICFDDGRAPWRLIGPGGAVAEIDPPARLRSNSGDAALVWAVAGQGIMLKSMVDVIGDIRAGCLERVLLDWQSEAMPVYALLPSGRHVATKTRSFLEALSTRLLVALPDVTVRRRAPR
ncbi:MAG: LysR family transcriptional regulator [Alphaproteobacteria bacterium]|nr:LysR family transcriptional regulator [Alphaproteobacteria bacterium]